MDFNKNDFLSDDWQGNEDVDRDSEGFEIDNWYESFPHTKEGMLQLFNVIRGSADYDAWSFLWNSPFLSPSLKALVALEITTVFHPIEPQFPGLTHWIHSLAPDSLQPKTEPTLLIDLILRDLESGHLRSSFSPNDENPIITALSIASKQNFFQGPANGFVAVRWVSSIPSNRKKGIRIYPRVDFFYKQELLTKFHNIPEYDNFRSPSDILDLSPIDTLVLIMRCDSIKPAINLQSAPLLLPMLRAEVPSCTNEANNVASTFLRNYCNNFRPPENPYCDPSRHNCSEEDMTRFSRDVFLYNKVALYQALKQVYLELNGPE